MKRCLPADNLAEASSSHAGHPAAITMPSTLEGFNSSNEAMHINIQLQPADQASKRGVAGSNHLNVALGVRSYTYRHFVQICCNKSETPGSGHCNSRLITVLLAGQ